MKQRAIFRDHPFETIEHGTNLLQLRQLPARDHEEMSTRATKPIQRRDSRGRDDAVMSERPVVIASERAIFHLQRLASRVSNSTRSLLVQLAPDSVLSLSPIPKNSGKSAAQILLAAPRKTAGRARWRCV